MRKFYVYVYFDPRSQGNYNILDETFNYKPIYIGKGQGDRVLKHIKSNKKTKLINLNKKLIKEGIVPCYKILQEFENENEAHELESYLIKCIGREDLSTGPLFNLTSGGEGASGRIWTKEEKTAVSERSINYWNSVDEVCKKNHGIKSKANKTHQGIIKGIKKRKQTRAGWSEGFGREIESRRKSSWRKSYCNTKEKKEQRSSKCKEASLKRSMYYLMYLKEDGTYKSEFLRDLIARGWGKDALEWRIKGKLPLDKPYKVKLSNETVILKQVEKKPYSIS
jgi:hypothetical protein